MSLPPKIIDKNGSASYGGSQMWLPDKVLLNSGCGVIAGLDAIMRLKGEESLPKDDYINRFFDAKDYIRPIIVGKNRESRQLFGHEFLGSFGVSAARFKKGVKKLAAKEGLKVKVKPFRFRWWEKIPRYLESGDPLIMLITAPFNNVAVVAPNGFRNMCGFHWVTITGIEGDTLRVSSWGWECTMSIKELRKFNVILHFYSVSLENQSNLV
jgi:hypothetical protein